jgi:hypothetical protein
VLSIVWGRLVCDLPAAAILGCVVWRVGSYTMSRSQVSWLQLLVMLASSAPVDRWDFQSTLDNVRLGCGLVRPGRLAVFEEGSEASFQVRVRD